MFTVLSLNLSVGKISTDLSASSGIGNPTVPIGLNGNIKPRSSVKNQKFVSSKEVDGPLPSLDGNGKSNLVVTEQLTEAIQNFFLSLWR